MPSPVRAVPRQLRLWQMTRRGAQEGKETRRDERHHHKQLLSSTIYAGKRPGALCPLPTIINLHEEGDFDAGKRRSFNL
jgi:hypothetical protein